MINRQRRSAPSRFQFQIPTLFTLAAAKDCIGLIFRSATAFTNRLTLERRGHILDWATVNRSHSWLSIQKIPTASSWQLPVIGTDKDDRETLSFGRRRRNLARHDRRSAAGTWNRWWRSPGGAI